MISANPINLEKRESFVIEITEDFEKDLNKLTTLQQKQVDKKLQRIGLAIESNDDSYLYKDLQKVHSVSLYQYTSSLHILKVNKDLRIFLFYVDDPIFNSKIMTLLRVCLHKNMNKVLKNLCESFYQNNLKNIGEIDDEGETFI